MSSASGPSSGEPQSVEEKPAEGRPSAPAAKKPRRKFLFLFLAIVLAAGAIFGVRTVLFYSRHVETDDAQVEGHIAPVLPKVSGYVTKVLVDDNQRVQAGQLVLTIDERDLKSKVATAQADLQNARAAVDVARAQVSRARTGLQKGAADLARYAALRQKEEVSSLQYDAAKAAADAASADVEAALQSVAAAQAKVDQKQADLDFTRLQLSYSSVAAPESGTVSRKSVEVGQFVQAGQPLLAIVSSEQPWVIANFKETQLKKMRVGQPATIEVDAYPKVEFHGKIDSIAAATGAKFALLPPDNATGNFTKVVQRVPVKIVLTGPPDLEHPLRAGMSVNTIVTTR